MNRIFKNTQETQNATENVKVTWIRRKTVPPDSIAAPVATFLAAGVHGGAHLIVVDSEVGLLAPEVPLYDRPALKPYKQLWMGVTRKGI